MALEGRGIRSPFPSPAANAAYIYTAAPTPAEATQALIDEVLDLVAAGVLSSGQANGLIAKINGVIEKLNKGQVGPAINQLGAFIMQVQELVNDGQLPPADGQALSAAAQAVLEAIEKPEKEKPDQPEFLHGLLTSATFFLNHADCRGLTGSWNFFLNDVSLGSAGTTVGCQCNSDEQVVTFTDRSLLSAWNPNDGNTLRVEVNAAPSFNVAVGYIRALLETQSSDGTFAVFDATDGDASNRNLCEAFRWNHQQNVFTVTAR